MAFPDPEADPPPLPGSEVDAIPAGLSQVEAEAWSSLAPRLEDLRWSPGRGRPGISIRSNLVVGRRPEALVDLRWDERHGAIEMRVQVHGGKFVKVVLHRGSLKQLIRFLVTAGQERLGL